MGNEFVVRSEFSPTQDLVIRTWNTANEAAYLIPKNLPLKDYRKGQLIHMNSDEYPAEAFGGWGFLSGNHGSPFGRTLLIPDQRQKNLYCGKNTLPDPPYGRSRSRGRDSIGCYREIWLSGTET